MSKNMSLTMDRLKIDSRIRDLVRQLWKHCYRTSKSCEGHSLPGFIIYSGGDGWFEKNAHKYGLKKEKNNPCCENYDWGRCCGECGAGINGNSIYRGRLIQNPFKPELKN